jgi:D-aminopeptidase
VPIVSGRESEVAFDEKKVDEIFSHLDQSRQPGAVVGVAVRGKPLYRKGFGLANAELPVVLTPSIRLRIGSTSKHFTCFAYMLLCEDGKARIDDKVGRYFPELNPVIHGATMRQLMGNTSGIRDVYHIFDLFNDLYYRYGGAAQSVGSEDLLALYRQIDDVNIPPDTAWIYNNGGWLLLSIAIERISGQTLEEFMWSRIFKPVGMYNSLFLRSDTGYIENRGAQHVLSPNGGFERLYWGVDSHMGAGAIVSTVDDMIQWTAHMDNPTVGNEQTWTLMRTPGRLLNGSSTGYGLGLMIDKYRGIPTLHHAGNALGGNAQMLKVPSLGLDVVVIVNRQDVSSVSLAYKVLDACVTNLLPLQETSTPPFASGTYRSSTSGRVIQLYEREGKQFASVGGVDLPLMPDDDGVLWYTDLWRDGKFGIKLVGDRECPELIRVTDFGNADEFLVERPANPNSSLDIHGRYDLKGASVVAIISNIPSGISLRATGPFGVADYRLERLADRIWRARPAVHSRVGYLGGILSFSEDGETFSFSNIQMRSLVFRRNVEATTTAKSRSN